MACIPQAAMNALNPTRKIIHFIEDVIQEHDLYVTKKDIYERAKRSLRIWAFRCAKIYEEWDLSTV